MTHTLFHFLIIDGSDLNTLNAIEDCDTKRDISVNNTMVPGII